MDPEMEEFMKKRVEKNNFSDASTKTNKKPVGSTVCLVAGSVAVVMLAISWLIILPYVHDYWYVMNNRLQDGTPLYIIGTISGFIALIKGGFSFRRDSYARTGFLLGIVSVIISGIIFLWGWSVALYL